MIPAKTKATKTIHTTLTAKRTIPTILTLIFFTAQIKQMPNIIIIKSKKQHDKKSKIFSFISIEFSPFSLSH